MDDYVYSVPTMEKTVFNGEELYTSRDKAIYVIKPTEKDVIIFKDHKFFDIYGHQITSKLVHEAFKNHVV